MDEAQKKTYACPECGFHYREEATMKKCEAWCKEHGACSDEITAQSIERQCADLEMNWKRALADYQNLQKEVAKERETMAQYATLRAVERFLPVFDNFNTAMSHMPKSGDKAVVNWAVGVGFIQKQLEDVLRGIGVNPIKTEGQKFDASKHEAAGEEESDKEHGTILKEVHTGYEIGGKTVRPARVIIAK